MAWYNAKSNVYLSMTNPYKLSSAPILIRVGTDIQYFSIDLK